MALDRWIALAFLLLCLVYGYTAWFTMDGSLPPFMRRNPVWPSTFPKVIAIVGALVAIVVLVTQGPPPPPKDDEIDWRRLRDYQLGMALGLVGLMLVYAAVLRPLGFIPSTVLFLTLGATILGERKFHVLIPVSAVAAGGLWYVVEQVLGIFLRPWPAFL
jgi:putative tricarboxylic transport membrane protein